MKIKIGKLQKDVTVYSNKYWIQIEDNKGNDNSDLEFLVNREVSIVVDEIKAIDDFIQSLPNEPI